MKGRIYFPGNPWPRGHRLTELTWGGTLHPLNGLGIHLSLKSAEYYEGEDDQFPFSNEDEEDNWKAKSAWANYHACSIIPSMTSDSYGIPVSDGQSPFMFDLPAYDLSADPLPKSVSDVLEHGVFGIYLLGHDAVADHLISMTRQNGDGDYAVRWTGRIALAYFGGEEFDHEFHVEAEGVCFDAISMWHFKPEVAKEYLGLDLDPKKSPRDWLAPYVDDPDRFRFEDRHGTLHAVRLYG
jgi:hypothetical protein